MAVHVSVKDLMGGRGVVIIKRNPWTKGKLLDIAMKLGKRPDPFIPSNTVPWDKELAGADWEKHLSPSQKKVIDTFRSVAEGTKDMPLEQRLKMISEALAGKDFGGKEEYKKKRRKRIFAYTVL